MMTRLFRAGCLALAVGLAGCAAAPEIGRADGPRAAARVPVNTQTEAPDLGALETYSIPRGQCGMVLYTLAGTTPVPVFRSLDDGSGLVEVDGQLAALRLVGRGGDARMTVPSAQYFEGRNAAGAPFSVAVATRWGSGFPSGSYVDSGTITLQGADGWTRVVPVAGLAGCRTTA